MPVVKAGISINLSIPCFDFTLLKRKVNKSWREIATFDEDHVYDQADSAGFIHLFGLPLRVRAKLNEKLAKDEK